MRSCACPRTHLPSDIIDAVPLDLADLGPLVGRDEVLGRLLAAAGVAGAGAVEGGVVGGLVVLSGDAGIGKTRILSELAGRARSQRTTVLVGHCPGEGGSALPYLPFTEMLGRLEVSDLDALQELTASHPQLTALLPGRRAAGDTADTVDRAGLLEAVHAAFEDLGRRARLLVVVEDLHWADPSSRDLVTLLFTRGFAGPVSLVVSYRSEDIHRRHPLRSALAVWSRLPQVTRIELPPLEDGAVRQLVRTLQPRQLEEPEVQALVDRAEGNAFFAEELVAAGAWGGRGGADDLSRLLLVRFDALEEGAQQVVRTASASGRSVSHRLLAAVAGLPGSELDSALRQAVEHHVIVPSDKGGYTFRHALLGETVYDDLLPGERVRLHSAYAAALTSDKALGTAADLVRHAEAIGDREVTRDASIRAGDEAMSVGGPEEACRHYLRALALLPDAHPDADSVTLKAANAATAVGGALKALDLLQDRLARRPTSGDVESDVERRAELMGALATTARLTESTLDTLGVTTEALRLLTPERASGLRARLLAAHVQALADRGRDEEVTRSADEAIALADEVGLREVADEVRVVLARTVERVGNPEESRQALERILADPSVRGTPAELRARHHLGSLHHRSGRLREAMAVYRLGADRARTGGVEWAPYAMECRLLAGVAGYEAGEWEESDRVLDLVGESPPQPAKALLVAARLYLSAGRGELDARARLPGVRPWWEREGLVAVLSGSAAIDLHGDAGDVVQAIGVHDDVVAVLSRLWHPHFQAQLRISALLLGQLATHARRVSTREREQFLGRGREAAAAATAVWAQVSERGHGGPEAFAWEARARAEWLRLRWLAGDDLPDRAELAGAWRETVARFEHYGHRYEAARSQARLAAVLRAAGDPETSALADTARASAVRLGAKPLLGELRELRANPGVASHRRGTVTSLTPREQEILALVALGRSNKQIGTQLFISTKTASVHVSNIIAKLGVSGRGEAVAVARDRGLLAG